MFDPGNKRFSFVFDETPRDSVRIFFSPLYFKQSFLSHYPSNASTFLPNVLVEKEGYSEEGYQF